ERVAQEEVLALLSQDLRVALRVAEGQVHRLVQVPGGEDLRGELHHARLTILGGGDELRARRRLGDGAVAVDAGDLLDQVRFARDVDAEGRNSVRGAAPLRLHLLETEAAQDASALLVGDLGSQEFSCPLEADAHGLRLASARVLVDHATGHRPTGELDEELRGPVEGEANGLRVASALEAVRGFGVQAVTPGAATDAGRVEVGTFEENA